MKKLKYVKLFENFNQKENGIIISNSYSKNGIEIIPNEKKWKFKLPEIDKKYIYILHNTNSQNLDSILSKGLKVNRMGKASGHVEDYFTDRLISHRGGNVSIVVVLSNDEYYALSRGIIDNEKYNITIKDGIIPPYRIIGYIEIPNVKDGEHNTELVFYKNDKFNISKKLDILKEEIPEFNSPFDLKKVDKQDIDELDIDFGDEWN
jgi:hypothetical protein